ncbi:hypothetical protein EMIHUDRAFT_234042 [Emiliania huxleyi CCMP1516]|uniref:Uncharacterized protein n=2 Tax=Emiliania huxleyi TaxID=2903 RepID=A0A0D3K030_EMIH1|nr:hypothetical protein EMIHUDRAFT_234042 [Emiliania huxleyi CCMP1516]EOD29115.1 hypothetical protein EMIHUDRAFT_234042 [Emiliania huxleyi CCMP1516]|eukprot:XP_005781544.1 hypothetical protein EMIHUDRAFT_234042 [Emiliania huxleyi CCMP1516]
MVESPLPVVGVALQAQPIVHDAVVVAVVVEGVEMGGVEQAQPLVASMQRAHEAPPTVAPDGRPAGAWSSDICDCCSQCIPTCFMACCCEPCALGQLAERLKRNGSPLCGNPSCGYWRIMLALFFCSLVVSWQPLVPVWTWYLYFVVSVATGILVRKSLRVYYSIPGPDCCPSECCRPCDDFFTMWCCGPCAVAQMLRHVFPYESVRPTIDIKGSFFSFGIANLGPDTGMPAQRSIHAALR